MVRGNIKYGWWSKIKMIMTSRPSDAMNYTVVVASWCLVSGGGWHNSRTSVSPASKFLTRYELWFLCSFLGLLSQKKKKTNLIEMNQCKHTVTYNINQGCNIPQSINTCKTNRTPRSMAEQSIDSSRKWKKNAKGQNKQNKKNIHQRNWIQLE